MKVGTKKMKQLASFFCLYPAVFLFGFKDANPPDSNHVYHQKVSIFCDDYSFSAIRLSRVKVNDSILYLPSETRSNPNIKLFSLIGKSGVQYVIQFENFTTVCLNTVTTLLFNPQKANHFELTNGEAYFEVRQTSRIQINNKMGLWALAGTEINVKRYGDIEVSLLKGKAKIDINGSALELGEGETFKYSPNNDFISILPINWQNLKAWVNETFNYSRISYKELLEILARWYVMQVNFDNMSSDKWISFTGKYEEPLNTILERLNSKVKRYQCISEGGKLKVMQK